MNKQEFQNLLDFGMTPAQIISTALNDHLPNAATRMAMFVYGSSVYQNKTPSDIDVKVVVDKTPAPFELVIGDYNVHVVSFDDFLEDYLRCDIVTLECMLAPEHTRLMDTSVIIERYIAQLKQYGVNLACLRETFSQTASNSYVKAKKKLIVPESYDLECSRKSMWHSLRILAFGKSIATTNSIDFQEMNEVYETVLEVYEECNNDWEQIREVLKPVYNHYASEFREVAPKFDNSHFADKMQSSHGYF